MKLKSRDIIDVLVILAVWAFLLNFFKPSLLFLKTITTGGDTASHYYSALYLRDVLLPQGKVMGWMQGNYAGFPVFYHYFPLPFVLMALLGYVIPLQVSFKLITVLGTFLFPLCVYLMFRLFRYSYPTPILGAVFSLAFLFNERNSMWGGNIPSTLAGEFSFSFSLAVFLLFLAAVYRGMKENKWVALNAVLFFLMGFSHGYTLLFFAFLSVFYVFHDGRILSNIWYLFRVGALGGALCAFWFLPFIANLPFVTPFHITWIFKSVWEVFPPVLIPFFILSVVTLFVFARDRRTWLFAYVLLAAAILYFAGPKMGLVDIRFLTFLQLFLAIIGAIGAGELAARFKLPQLVPVILLLAVFIWANENTGYIRYWIEWNYSGFERKAAWPEVSELFEYLRKTDDGGRVVYENAVAYETLGTQRIFESLKMFAGRDTLEGLYMQSSITGPFVFYIQSEISRDVSAPFWSYPVSPFELVNGARHLRDFSVTQFIVRSDKVKKAIKRMPEFKFERSFGACDVYRVSGAEPQRVVLAENQPVLYTGKDWKKDSYAWFKVPENQAVPVVFAGKSDEKDKARFALRTENAVDLERAPLEIPRYSLSEKIGDETIEFETSLVGHPHIIRISYHPNWKVEGADKIYMVSPTFMLVYPAEKKVRLTFSKNIYNYGGEALSLLGWIFIIYRVGRALSPTGLRGRSTRIKN